MVIPAMEDQSIRCIAAHKDLIDKRKKTSESSSRNGRFKTAFRYKASFKRIPLSEEL